VALVATLVQAVTAQTTTTTPPPPVIDQQSGAPGGPCTTTTFPGGKVLSSNLSESRQSFKANLSGLLSVDLCLDKFVGTNGNDLTMSIYSGTLSNPGTAMSSVGVDIGPNFSGARWVHIALPAKLATSVGSTYVIGVRPVFAISPVTFTWRANCGGTVSCTGVPDAYPNGSTSDLTGADYGFRTYTDPPDLAGTVTIDQIVCPGEKLPGHASGTVTNNTGTAMGPFSVDWVWSGNAIAGDGDDIPIAGSKTTISGLGAQSSISVAPPAAVPTNAPFTSANLLMRVDVDNQIPESDETNNVEAGATTVTECGQPNLTGLALNVTEPQVQTGFNQVQFSNLDPAALASLPESLAEAQANPGVSPNGFSPNGFSTDTFSANGFSPNGFSPNGFSPNGFSPNGFSPNGFSPNGFSPNGFSPNGFSPNGFSPAGSVLLKDVLANLPSALLNQVLVVNVPISGVSWESRLTGLTTDPIQNMTLGQASALLPTVRLDEVDLSNVLKISALSLATANAPANDTPLQDGRSWCQFITDNGGDCTALGIDPSTMSILGIEGRFPLVWKAPVADQPLGAVTTSHYLANSMTLSGSPRFNWEHTRLGQLPINQAVTNPSAVADCVNFDCSRSFVAAARAGMLKGTLGTVLSSLTATGKSTGIVADLALGMMADDMLPLANMNWNLANSYTTDNSCPRMTYHLTGSNTGTARSLNPKAQVTLPPGFVYVPSTTTLTIGSASAVAQADPAGIMAANGARTYTFALQGAIGLNQSFDVKFSACAGLYLGSYAVGSATMSGLGMTGPYSASTTSTDTVNVVERTPGVTTVPVGPSDNVVIADHISTANAYDSVTYNVPSTPGSLVAVHLWTPPGVDLDLIGYGPASSANGFTPNGFSPNGFSPNGFSPNGFSPNGFSPNGFSPNGFSPNGFSPNGFSSTASPELLDDVPVEQLRPAGTIGDTVSAHRGGESEVIYLRSNFGDQGHFTFSVTDWNGATSNAPYFLTIQTLKPTPDPRLNTCAPAPWDLSQTPGAAPSWTGAGSPHTLFVTNRQVLASTYGATAADAGIAALQSLANRPEIAGYVLNVDSSSDVRSEYANWRADWCNPTEANLLATKIRSLILAERQKYPTIDTVVIAGGDPVLPNFRLTDTSAMANENEYTDSLLNTYGSNNPTVAAYANGTIPSDDPYGNDAVVQYGTSYAFPPSIGVSRLPEDPNSWIPQVNQYVANNGDLSPTKGMVSGYVGMLDGAKAAAAVLQGANIPTTVLGDDVSPWTANDFRQQAFTNQPDIAGYNAHANHWSILSASGSLTHSASELVTTAEASGIKFGSLIFSNGCHFGVSATNALNPNPTSDQATRLADWDQAITGRGGIAVANTGFGIFDTATVGQGERLQQLFVQQLMTAPNASIALARAKNLFFATQGVYDSYTYKVMQELNMFGLGIFKMAGASRTSTGPVRPPTTSTPIDVSTGSYAVASAPSSCTSCFVTTPGSNGTAVDLVDATRSTGHTSTNGYWSAPTSTQAVVLPVGESSAGLWFGAPTATALPALDPVITRLAVSRPEEEPEVQAAAPFPTLPGRAVDVGPTSYVTLMQGEFVPTSLVNNKVTGDAYLFTHINAQLLLRAQTTTACIPSISQVRLLRSATDPKTLAIEVRADEVACGGNKRAAVVLRDDTGAFQYRELAKGSDGFWHGSVTIAGSTVADVLTEVDSGLGVAYDRYRGDQPTVPVGTAQGGVSTTLAGPQYSTGTYTGPVTVTLHIGAPTLCTAYDNGNVIGTFSDGQSFTVTADGTHSLNVVCANGDFVRQTISIDATTPVVTITTPPASASYYTGTQVLLAYTATDTPSAPTVTATNDGQAISNGQPINTSTVGTHTVVVTACDSVAHCATVTRTYTVNSKYTISQFQSPVLPKPQLNSVSASSSVALKWTVTDASGNYVTDLSIIQSQNWIQIDCQTFARIGAPFQTTSSVPGVSGTTYHYNTNAPSVSGQCDELVVTLTDGSYQSAYFKVK
jgi:uncharacterized repeat protein (TIGR01451 family)